MTEKRCKKHLSKIYVQQVFDGHIKFVETLWLVTIVKKLFMTSTEFCKDKNLLFCGWAKIIAYEM